MRKKWGKKTWDPWENQRGKKGGKAKFGDKNFQGSPGNKKDFGIGVRNGKMGMAEFQGIFWRGIHRIYGAIPKNSKRIPMEWKIWEFCLLGSVQRFFSGCFSRNSTPGCSFWEFCPFPPFPRDQSHGNVVSLFPRISWSCFQGLWKSSWNSWGGGNPMESSEKLGIGGGFLSKPGIEFLRMRKFHRIQRKLGNGALAPIPNIPTWNSHSLELGEAPLEPQIPPGAGEFLGFSLWMHLDTAQRAGKAAGKGGNGSIPGKTFGIPEIPG